MVRETEDEKQERELREYNARFGMTKTAKEYLVKEGARFLHLMDLLKKGQVHLTGPLASREVLNKFERRLRVEKIRLNLLETLFANGTLGVIMEGEIWKFELKGFGGIPLGFILNLSDIKDFYTRPETFESVNKERQLFNLLDEVIKKEYPRDEPVPEKKPEKEPEPVMEEEPEGEDDKEAI